MKNWEDAFIADQSKTFDVVTWIWMDDDDAPVGARVEEVDGWVDLAWLEKAFEEDGLYFLEYFLAPEGYPAGRSRWRIRPYVDTEEGYFESIEKVEPSPERGD